MTSSRLISWPSRSGGSARTARDQGGGAGLGLSIVAAIAEAHGGTLDLRARPEGGLRVAIGLPLAAPVAAATTPRAGVAP